LQKFGREFVVYVLGSVSLLAVAAYLWLGSEDSSKEYVNVYNWYGMIPKDVIDDFESETGIHVNYDLYDNNEIVEAKLFSGNSGYDVIFPTASPYVERHIKVGVYQPLDKTQLSNLKNIDPYFLSHMERVDPGFKYSIPYYWGTFGFAYVEQEILKRMPDAPVDSYAMLFDPAVVSKFKGCGVTLLEESVDVYPAILSYLGLDPQSESPEDLQRAQDAFLKIRPYITRFSGPRFVGELVKGESCIAQAWSGEAQLAQQQADEAGRNITIRYVVPKEGAVLWIDTMAIPKDAPHAKNAHIFINFLLRPDIAARISDDILLPTTVLPSRPLIDKKITSDPNIFPPPEVLNRLKLDKPQNEHYEKLRTRAWLQAKLHKH
jgi:putrescine transport system substrate-binding protein